MFQIIFIVIDRFSIEGKGTALTGITQDDSLAIPVGAIITIKRPNLSDIQSIALGFEVFRDAWSPHKPRNFGILLPAEIDIDDIPPKSEIWCDV
ncbi:hypothetical protein LL974_04590 [Xanthomonas campestris pv. cannae]|nr:hypothetical protein [Xanthomonas campestris pv. cannae]